MYSMHRHGKLYKIYEKSTNQYICQSTSKERIQSILTNLMNGCGFGGTTPAFMFRMGLTTYAEIEV